MKKIQDCLYNGTKHQRQRNDEKADPEWNECGTFQFLTW